MVHVEDEDDFQGASHHRIHDIRLAGICKQHVQEPLGIAQVIPRIYNGHSCKSRNFSPWDPSPLLHSPSVNGLVPFLTSVIPFPT